MERMTYPSQCCGNCVWLVEVGDGHGVCGDKPWRECFDKLRASFVEDVDEPTGCGRFAPVYGGGARWTA